jgi:topoisomerase IA-like protein
MIDSITQLVPSGVRRLTTRDVPKYARVTLAQQLEMIAADKAEKEEKARRKAEKAAAKAAAAESGEAPAKPAAKARKKKEDLS